MSESGVIVNVDGNANTQSVKEFRKLGLSVSHGCVRVTTADAKWIYDYCNGATVRTFDDPNSFQPFDKPVLPKAIVVKGDFGIDPTDPNL